MLGGDSSDDDVQVVGEVTAADRDAAAKAAAVQLGSNSAAAWPDEGRGFMWGARILELEQTIEKQRTALSDQELKLAESDALRKQLLADQARFKTIISKLFDKIGVRKLAESEAELRRKTPKAKAMREQLKTDQARLAGKIESARSICLLCLESSDSGSDSDSDSDSDGDASYAVSRVTPAGGLPYGRQSHSHAPCISFVSSFRLHISFVVLHVNTGGVQTCK